MNITFLCRQCDRPAQIEVLDESLDFGCPHCDRVYAWREHFRQDRLDGCPVCGCHELYVRKNFSQRLGVAIVALGVLLSSIAWGYHLLFVTYGILFSTALIDVILYFAVSNMLQCYRCQAEYRGLAALADHEPFVLETHERYRQQAARLAEQPKP